MELGILWWIDKQIAQFIRKVSEQYPDSLFVITGDHTHYAYTQGVLSYREVPMLIYSPTLKIYPTSDVGSQLDIAPTILDLVSPQGFEYYSFGRPIFATQPEKVKNPLFNAFELVGDSQYVYTEHLRRITLKDYLVKDYQQADERMKKLLERLRDGRALSWYLFSKGGLIQKD